MILLLLALAGSQPSPAQPATLQSCEITPEGWVCRYSIPPVTLLDPDAPPPPITLAPPAPENSAEAARQAKLIADCADAGWLSLCLPKDRREARRLRDAAEARAALRAEVARLLSEDKCSEAVTTALAGGDMALAREARAFCAP